MPPDESGRLRAHERGGRCHLTRRRSPRPASAGLRAALSRSAPQTTLAAAQACWTEALGTRLAEACEPVSEGGTLTVSCADSVWAQELEMMQGQLLERLRAHMGDRAPTALRFRA